MSPTVEQLAEIIIFSGLENQELEQLLTYTQIRHYLRDEIILYEGDELPAKLSALCLIFKVGKSCMIAPCQSSSKYPTV